MDGRYHGMDYRKKNVDNQGWAAPIVSGEDWQSRERAVYRERRGEDVQHGARQRVAVGRNGEVHYSEQARETAARARAERYALPKHAPQIESPRGPGAAVSKAATVYTRPAEPQPAAVPEDDSIAAWEAQRAQEKSRDGRKKLDKRGTLEKKMSRIVLGIVSACFVAGVAMMVVLPRSTVSKIEKRELAELPQFSFASYFSGEFTAGVANYYDDTVPMRDALKNAGSKLKAVFGLPKSEESVEFVGSVNKVKTPEALPVPVSQPEESAHSSSSSEEPPVESGVDPAPVGESIGAAAMLAGAAGRHMDEAQPNGNKFIEQEAEQANMTENGLMVVKQDGHFRGLELFGGGLGESYAAALNDLYGQVGGHAQIWSMPAPLACEFYLPVDYQDYSTSQSDCFDETHKLLDPSIHAINMCAALSKHVEEPIYCRTDHHWQPLGAYYAAQVFAEAAGVPFNDLSTYEPGKIEGFVGSMYSYTSSADILNDPEDFVYYTPGVEYTSAYYDTAFNFQWGDDDLFAEGAGGSDAYMYYLGGDGYIVKTDTQVQNGRKLLIIKDSYGNAIVPFLTSSFQQIYVADVRYLERNLISFINDMGITDVLFTMSSYSLVGSQGANIANLLTQNAGETIIDGQ